MLALFSTVFDARWQLRALRKKKQNSSSNLCYFTESKENSKSNKENLKHNKTTKEDIPKKT